MGEVNRERAATKRMRDQHNAGLKTKVSRQLQELTEAAEAIPLRSKTQYPIYVEARTLFTLRGMAEIDGVSVQDVIRKALQEGIDKRLRKVPKKKTKRSGKTARSA